MVLNGIVVMCYVIDKLYYTGYCEGWELGSKFLNNWPMTWSNSYLVLLSLH